MKIKEAQNDIQKNIEELRKIRDEITKLHDDLADSDVDGKEVIICRLRSAQESVVNAIMSLEASETEYEEYLETEEEREAMGKFRSFRPW